MRSLNREAFEEKIWNDIIRNNRKRKDNLPTRRETALISLTTKMLQNEIYYYEILAEDDSEALSELEKSGVLFQSDDARRYLHSHDVFEELVVGHIFTERYRHDTLNEQFLPISTLLSASESYFADGWLILPLFQPIRSLFSTFSTANR